MKILILITIFLSPIISEVSAQSSTTNELPTNWQKSAFQRFKAKAENLSGHRTSKGGKGMRYTKGPLKNKTTGEAEEWCIATWSKMSLSARKKYYDPTVTKQQANTTKGAPVILKVGQSFNINGTRGTVGKIEVIDDKTLRITLNMTSHTGASTQTYDISIK